MNDTQNINEARERATRIVREWLITEINTRMDDATYTAFAWHLAAHPWEQPFHKWAFRSLVELAYVCGAL